MEVDEAEENQNPRPAAGEEKVKSQTMKEGSFLLGSPTFVELGNGRWRCEESGHDLSEKEKESYARTNACRLSLIDAAISSKKPPLNTFQLHPLSKSMLVCTLTGDVINKSEEHIWKHINGKRFFKKLEEKEEEKMAEKVDKNKKGRKKSMLKAFSIHENQNLEAEGNGSLAREDVCKSTDSEEADFWVPPVGKRWDFDDGKDRWESLNTSGQEKEVNNDIGLVNEENEGEAMELSIRTKRLAIALGPNSFATRKKKTRKT